MFPPKRHAGTKEDPNIVPSITDKRIVGCICKCLLSLLTRSLNRHACSPIQGFIVAVARVRWHLSESG